MLEKNLLVIFPRFWKFTIKYFHTITFVRKEFFLFFSTFSQCLIILLEFCLPSGWWGFSNLFCLLKLISRLQQDFTFLKIFKIRSLTFRISETECIAIRSNIRRLLTMPCFCKEIKIPNHLQPPTIIAKPPKMKHHRQKKMHI